MTLTAEVMVVCKVARDAVKGNRELGSNYTAAVGAKEAVTGLCRHPWVLRERSGEGRRKAKAQGLERWERRALEQRWRTVGL